MDRSKFRGICVSGFTTDKPSTLISVRQFCKARGIKIQIVSLKGSNNYWDLAITSWRGIKDNVLIQMQKIADTNTDTGKTNLVFAYSFGAIAALLASLEYCKEVLTPIDGTGDSSEIEVSEPGKIDLFIAYNPPISLTWLGWTGLYLAVGLKVLLGAIPFIGYFFRFIPIARYRERDGKIRYIPLGASLTIFQALREFDRATKSLVSFPFRLVIFSGTDDLIASGRASRSWASIKEVKFVPVAFGTHDLFSKLSEDEVEFLEQLTEKFLADENSADD